MAFYQGLGLTAEYNSSKQGYSKSQKLYGYLRLEEDKTGGTVYFVAL